MIACNVNTGSLVRIFAQNCCSATTLVKNWHVIHFYQKRLSKDFITQPRTTEWKCSIALNKFCLRIFVSREDIIFRAVYFGGTEGREIFLHHDFFLLLYVWCFYTNSPLNVFSLIVFLNIRSVRLTDKIQRM